MMDIRNIAITGVAGRFPNCLNIDELQEALFKGVDLVTDGHGRWPCDVLGTPDSMGVVRDLDKYDASFFGMNHKKADQLDPKTRKLQEVVYEAVADAGFSVNDIKGSNTGVFLAVMQSFAEQADQKSGCGIFNRSIALMANGISYAFDLKGPSYAMDTGCSTSIYAINHAIDNIRQGYCDSAIVAGSQCHLLPAESVDFASIGVLSPDGRVKAYDENRNGYVKADAVVAIYLQKVSDAKRIYCTIEGVGTNVDGYKDEGMSHPSAEMQFSLLNTVYKRYNIDPNDVSFIEAHGTGTLVGDIEECQAILDFYFQNRDKPLLLGSHKSNMGHSESTSGLVSMVKAILTFRTGYIPKNLHFETPALDIPGLLEGKLKVVSENTKYDGGLFAINSFGFGGANGHLVLRPYTTENPKVPTIKPRLVQVSGRTSEGVKTLLDSIEQNKDNLEFISMVEDIFQKPIKNHGYRGYTILGKDVQEVSKSPSKKRPIWFFYAGMGSQWPGMAKDLMSNDIFRASMQRCAQALKPYNIDIMDIVLNGTAETFEDCVNCFSSVVAMQVALTDVLKSMGIVPDGIFGHSLGEIGCAYADGLLTAEEATLVAFARGFFTKDCGIIPGYMASVGLSFEEAQKILPTDIDISSINADDNVTISGPQESVKAIEKLLTEKGIFVRIVNTAGLAFHSRYIQNAGPKLMEFFKKVIPNPKPRTSKWLSTSISESEWGNEIDQFNSPEYHYNNFMNRVLLKQVYKYIPKDAILVEIAPRGLFQAIFRRNLDNNITNISLVSQLESDNTKFFLSSIGKIYMAGGQPNLDCIKNSAAYPVSYKTPMIGPLIKWDHSITWSVPQYQLNKCFGTTIEFDLSQKENKFFLDHILDGVSIFPFTGYLLMVWKTFANMHGKSHETTPIVFKNIKVLSGIVLNENDILTFIVNIFADGKFEVTHNSEIIAVGSIALLTSENNIVFNPTHSKNENSIKLDGKEFYKLFGLAGNHHRGVFNPITEIDIGTGRSGAVEWLDNWVSLMDSMLTFIICYETRYLYLPNGISKLTIDPFKVKESLKKSNILRIDYEPTARIMKLSGLILQNLQGKCVNRRLEVKPILENYNFTPYYNPKLSELEDTLEFSLRTSMQTVVDNNVKSSNIIVKEFGISKDKSYRNIIKDVTHKRYMKLLSVGKIENICKETLGKINLLILDNLSNKSKEELNVLQSLNDTFIFTELQDKDEAIIEELNLIIISKYTGENVTYGLLKKQARFSDQHKIIKVKNHSMDWVEELKEAIIITKGTNNRIYLVADYNYSGVAGFYNSLREEYVTSNVRVYLIRDKYVEEFSVNSNFYKQQIAKDLTVNIYDNGQWGAYRFQIKENNITKMAKNAYMIHQKNLVWVEDSPYTSENEERINVQYASLNKIEIDTTNVFKSYLGLEYTGVDSKGKRFMGLSMDGTLKTSLENKPVLSWELPQSWDLETSAKLPLPLTMCYYGLINRAALRPSNSILILDEKNSFTYVAIGLALKIDAQVYISVKSRKDAEVLTTMFKKITEDNLIYSAKGSAVEETVMLKTKGQGVDVIFTTNQKKIENLLHCTALGGKIVDINMKNVTLPTQYYETFYEKDCAYHNITLENLFKDNVDTLQNEINILVQTNIIDPNLFKCHKVERESAVEFLQNNTKEEKVLININDEITANGIESIAKSYFKPGKVFVVIGGTGGFGLELVNWMITRGANKFVLNSRRGIVNGYQAMCVNKWKSMGCDVLVSTDDTTTYEGSEDMLMLAMKLGPIGGIINTAMVLENDLFENLSPAQFEMAVAPKLYSAENMDKLSRVLFLDLDYFILFSSIASSVGNAGQSNYGYANAALERLCENRKMDNLPAMAMQWGAVADVGYLANLEDTPYILESIPQSIRSCLNAFDFFLQQDNTVVASSVYSNHEEGDNVETERTVADHIAKLFGVKNIKSIDVTLPFVNLGMDSILGFEIRNIILNEFNIDYSVNEIRQISFEDIQKLEQDKINSL